MEIFNTNEESSEEDAVTLEAVESLVDKRLNQLGKTLKDGLSEFENIACRNNNDAIAKVKEELMEEFKSSLHSMEISMKKEIADTEQRILHHTETKIAGAIEDVLSKGSFSFLPGGTFDESVILPKVTILHVPDSVANIEPPAKKICLQDIAGPSQSEPVTPAPAKLKTPSSKKYSWKRDNPAGEEFIVQKCAAVKHQRNQCVKEAIYEEGVKEGIWPSNDQVFMRVSMKIDSVCKNALG